MNNVGTAEELAKYVLEENTDWTVDAEAFVEKVEENVILYKDGMTVTDLANLLGEAPVEIVKKLVGLGIMANVNYPLSFEIVELLVLDYDKELKKIKNNDNSYLSIIRENNYLKNKYGKKAAFETILTFPEILSVWKNETERGTEKYSKEKQKAEYILKEVASVFTEI